MPWGEQHVEPTDAVAAGLPGSQVREGLGASTCCHTFRATGITAYL